MFINYWTFSIIMYMYVFALCSVGHGRSEGDRVHVETFRTYIEDVVQDVEQMKEQYPNTPSLLMGHSMVSIYICMLSEDQLSR